MEKKHGFLAILIPSATVFISSFCIMVLELVASRLIARHLGSSLYTWTAVIGVVLAGITIGNYLGGRIADKYQARKALSVIFLLCSVSCVITIILNNIVGGWLFLWYLSWPMRIFSHVSLVFIFPSILLGTISPVVAKMALDKGLPQGRTVGDIYAWGAAGSIAGTFAAGYFLIAAMGTIAIIWTIGAVLLLMGILYQIRFWVLYTWAAIFTALMSIGIAPVGWAKTTGASLVLREKPNPNVIYEDESQYCYIAVKRTSEAGDRRAFMQDKLRHSEILMDDKYNLQYFHTIVFAAVTHHFSKENSNLSVFHIGGGGYVFPQYIEKNWPGSLNDVAEIDADVTKAATAAFGLSGDTTINTIQMDARNYIDELLKNKSQGETVPKYDFIYEDAFSDYSVPYQLVTKEFNDKIHEILTDDGIYMINSIDSYDSGRFVGAYINTLEKTFPYVYAIAEGGPHSGRKIFVLIASKIQIQPDEYLKQYRRGLDFWFLNDNEIENLKQKAEHEILTDNYVPVESMLASVVRQSAANLLAGKLLNQAKKLQDQDKLDKAIKKYYQVCDTDPMLTILALNEIALIQTRQGNLEDAARTFQKVLEHNEKSDFKDNMANIHASLGTVLRQLNRLEQANEQYEMAIKGYHDELQKNPESHKTCVRLGDVLATIGNFKEASEYFSIAVKLNPVIPENHMKLIQSLEFAQELDRAIEANTKAIQFFTSHNQPHVAKNFKQYLELLEFKKSKQRK